MINYFLIHGSFGNANEHYFPWLKDKLKADKNTSEVINPDFPIGVGRQCYESWCKVLDNYKNMINEKTVFIGRSLAPVFIIKYLIENNLKIKALISVSGFNTLLNGDGEIDDYNTVNKTFFVDNLKLFKTHCKNRICIVSKNDPFIPYNDLMNFAGKNGIDADVVLIENGGHFNTDSGYITFEKLLEIVRNIK